MYVDDSEETEFVPASLWEALSGTVSEHQAALRRALTEMAVPTSVKKGVVRAPQALRKGVEVDGLAGRAAPSIRRLLEHAGLTAWLLDQKDVSLVEMQGACGRWVSNFVLRRQTLSCLDQSWSWIAARTFPSSRGSINWRVRDELTLCLMTPPLLVSDMRRPLDHRPLATDASEQGGGVSVGVQLTDEGVRAASEHASVPAGLHERGVAVIEFFGGIGGLRMSVDRLGVHVICAGYAETDKEARAVYRRNWPGDIEWSDVCAVARQQLEDLRRACPGAVAAVCAYGPPCQGVSGLNKERTGLADPRSALFFEVPRLQAEVRTVFYDVPVLDFCENVASMKLSDAVVMSEALARHPLCCCSSGMSLVARPRLYWPSFRVAEGEGGDDHPWRARGSG